MRIKSERNKKVTGVLYALCFLGVIFDLVVMNIDGSLGNLFKVTPFIIPIVVVFIYRGLPVFHYDSDGEVLNFTAEEPHLRWLGRWFVKHFEFPKRKLARFHIKSYPLRRTLTVAVQSKEGILQKQKINISYLNSKELSDLKLSLEKVLRKNNSD